MAAETILITGACGHIGSKLIDVLKTLHDCDIIACDNFMTQRYCSLFHLRHKIKFYDCDFLNIDIPENCTVIHLAAITNAAMSFETASSIEDINVKQTKQFIDKCIAAKIKRFIFPSSTSVYGTADEIVNEDDVKFENPQSPYAQSKLEIEQYLESKSSESELEYLILRFGTIFGISKGMRFHTAINKFCYQAALGLPLTIWKENYEQVRPYLSILDCVHAIAFFLKSYSSVYRNKYNILTGNYKLKDIIDMIKNKVPDLTLNMVDTPLLNQFSYNVDDSKVRKLGSRPGGKLNGYISFMLSVQLKNLRPCE